MMRRIQFFIAFVVVMATSVPPVSALPARLGDIDEDGIATIHDVVMILNHIHGRVAFAEDRISFADLNRDGVVDSRDVDQVANAVVAALALAEIDFNPTLDVGIPYTNSDRFTFSGTNFPRTQVRITHAMGTTQVQSDSTGAFSVELPIGLNSTQDYFLSGLDADGARLPLIPLRILQDSTGPDLELSFPESGSTTSEETIVVCGRISDSLSGHLGMAVDVNGTNASVFSGDGVKGSFVSGPHALNMGENTLEIRGTDAAGNSTLRQVTVTRTAPSDFRLVKESGDLQEAPVRDYLSDPITVQVQGPVGEALVGKPVVFEIVDGLGTLSLPSGGEENAQFSVMTDSNGRASISWRMSTVAGKGNHRLRVWSRGVRDDVVFAASALPNTSIRLSLVEGEGQVGGVGTLAPRALRVWVNDGGNALRGQAVQFDVVSGGGKVNGQDSFTVTSGAAGYAEVGYRLGSLIGPQRVSAKLVGVSGTEVVFLVNGIELNRQPTTSLDGLVLTPFLEPVPAVRLELVIEGTRFGPVQSDATGRFQFENLSSGAAELQLWLPSGNTSQSSPVAPLVTRPLVLARGVQRSLGQAIILPVTKNRTTLPYDGTSELVLSLAGNSDFALTIPAGSVRTRDGALPSVAAPLFFSLTQVPTSSLPNRPSNGESPRLAWLLEPSDVEFAVVPALRIPDLAGLNGASSVGVYGQNLRLQRFERQTSLVTIGAPVQFRNASTIGGVPAGFAFVNAGYQGGQATVTSGSSGPPVSSGGDPLDR